MVISALIGLVLIGGIALGYGLLAWKAGRRWGPIAIAPLWLAASVAFAAVVVFRTSHPGQPSVFDPDGGLARHTSMLFFGFALSAFGLESLALRRPLRGGHTDWDSGVAKRAVGAFFAGAGIWLGLVFLKDAVTAIQTF